MPVSDAQKAAGIINAALQDVILVPQGVNAQLAAIVAEAENAHKNVWTALYETYSTELQGLKANFFLAALLSQGYIQSQEDLSFVLSHDFEVSAEDSIAVTSFLFHLQTERMNLIVDELHKATEEIKDSVKTDVTVNIDSSTLGLDDLQGAIGAQYSNTLANMEALYGDIANAQAGQLDAQNAAFQATLDTMTKTATDTAAASAQSAKDLMDANSEQSTGFMEEVTTGLVNTYQGTIGAVVGIMSDGVSSIMDGINSVMAKPLEYLSGLLSDLLSFFENAFMDALLDISTFFKGAVELFTGTDDDLKNAIMKAFSVQQSAFSQVSAAFPK